MSLTASIPSFQRIDNTQNAIVVTGQIAVSGNYGSASSHGDTLDLSALGVPANSPPVRVEIWEQQTPGTSQSGWVYAFNPGTTQANGNMQVFGSGTSGQGLAEYTEAAAYASATPAIPTTLYFRAYFLPSLI